MDNKLPDISYERNMNQNYMILTNRDYFGNVVENNDDYRKKMLLENNIPGLLEVSHRLVNGEMRYYYRINSLESLESIYTKREINYEELRSILNGLIRLFESLEEYLLDGSQIILNPKYIYMNADTLEMYFVYYPEYEEDIREAFVGFADLLLTKIDHTDNDAVLLGYKIYRYTKNPNYVMSEIARLLESPAPAPIPQPENIQAPTPDMYQQQSFFEEFSDIDLELEGDVKPKKKREKKEKENKDKMSDNKKESGSLGIVICLIVAIIALALIICDKATHIIGIKGDMELYLYGIVAIAAAEAVVLSVTRAKKRKALEMT